MGDFENTLQRKTDFIAGGYAIKMGLFVTLLFSLMTTAFGVNSHAAIENCDFNDPKEGDVDGWDLAEFAAFYSGNNPLADVNKDGSVNEADVAYFAGFFGGGYTVTARRPNILLIIADDVGIDVTTGMYPNLITDLLTLYGPSPGHNHPNYLKIDGRPAPTPALDQLAHQGMVFCSAWAQPVCSPTRGALISGLFAEKTGVTAPGSPLSRNHVTFVRRLKDEANYSTALFGKCPGEMGSGQGNYSV